MRSKNNTWITQLNFLLSLTYCNAVFGIYNEDPEAYMNVTEVIKYHGYPVEEHEVTTEDGYILTLFNIPYGKNSTGGSRKPILIMHGVAADSASFIANTPDKNLPYLLAEKGYDVWLGNMRGCSLSQKHENLTTDDEEYWDFSFDEMAKYDIPSMTDYIIKKTGFKKIQYIGHSMGTSVIFALLSSQPDYDKIASVHALAPVARVDHAKSPFVRFFAKYSNQVATLLKLVGGYELDPQSKVFDLISKSICAIDLLNRACSTTVFVIAGFDYDQFNETRLPVILHFYPSATSTKTGQHLGQVFNAKRFQHFDYGKKKNQEIYNQATPPLYNVTEIKTPIYLYWGQGDWLAAPEDVVFLIKNVGNLKKNYEVPFKKFNHADFLWAIDVKSLLYDELFKDLESAWEE
uniref:Lipase n=1 Tax=Hemiscolopendra marginata TaxID=943146 RepID=A0A646QF92_9MYRI